MAQEAGAAVYSGCWELWLILGDGVHSGDAVESVRSSVYE